MTLTDTAGDLLGLAIVAGVVEHVVDHDHHSYKSKKKKKEDKPFKW
jgi:hypothetical protein